MKSIKKDETDLYSVRLIFFVYSQNYCFGRKLN